MSYGNDMNSLFVVPVNDLKRELLNAARPVPSVDSNEPFGIGLNVRNRDIDGNAEFTRRGGTELRVPIRGCLQLGRRFGMKTNSHRQHRAS